MKNRAFEITHRRRRAMRGIIPLARPVGESAFAFRPSAAEKSEQRSSLMLRINGLACRTKLRGTWSCGGYALRMEPSYSTPAPWRVVDMGQVKSRGVSNPETRATLLHGQDAQATGGVARASCP